MSNPIAIEKARRGKRRALQALYHVMVIDTPRRTTDGDMADLLRVDKQDVRNLRYDLVELGVLKTTNVTDIEHGRGTRRLEWRLVETQEVAEQKLNAKWAADDKTTTERLRAIPHPGRPRKVVPVSVNGSGNGQHAYSETVHIAGPDAPKPFAALSGERHDEPRALVEAARQYANLHNERDKKLKELEALGITINRDQLDKAIKLPNDPRLAAVADTLPYVDGLERQNERLTARVTDMQTKLGDLPAQQREVTQLRDQVRRLIAEKVDLQNRLQGRPVEEPRERPRPAIRIEPEAVTAGN